VKKMAWMQMAAWALLCNAVAQAQAPIPKEMPIPKEVEGWQGWVQDGQEFRHCPFFANTNGGSESDRVCAWPGRGHKVARVKATFLEQGRVLIVAAKSHRRARIARYDKRRETPALESSWWADHVRT